MDNHVRKVLTYRGYEGDFGLDDSGMFVGHVVGMKKSIITFKGETAAQLEESFHAAIDRYLNECAEKQCEPEHPFKGSFNIRIGVRRHAKLFKEAKIKKTSMNQLIILAIDKVYAL